jgi:hypothetical protein
MFTPKVTVDLRQTNADRFLDCAADYLDESGFTDLDREPARVIAKKGWPSGSNWGTLGTLSFFHSAVVQTQGSQASIHLGTARSFVAIIVAMFAFCMAGLWWLPPACRALVGIGAAALAYVLGTGLALIRAKLAFAMLARRCARQS